MAPADMSMSKMTVSILVKQVKALLHQIQELPGL